MLFRGEMSKRISHAFAVPERKENRTLREKGVRNDLFPLTVHQEIPLRHKSRGYFPIVRFNLLRIRKFVHTELVRSEATGISISAYNDETIEYIR